MSNYGFATYDERNSARRVGEVNSKWPIFGPKYNDISNCYKTYHFSDTTASVAKDVVYPLSAPSNGGSTFRYVTQKIEVFRRKHGFKKRPLGYVVFTGNVVKNVRCYIKQYHENGSAALGGDFELSGVNTATIPVKSSLQGTMETAYTSTGWNGYGTTLEDSPFTIYDGTTYSPTGDIKVPTAVPSRVKMTYYLYDDNGNPDVPPLPGGYWCKPPYAVEITDEDIVVYKNVYSCDIWYRTDSGSTRVYDRVKGITDYAGTEVDMTVMLCPYRMEDLL